MLLRLPITIDIITSFRHSRCIASYFLPWFYTRPYSFANAMLTPCRTSNRSSVTPSTTS